AQIQECALRVRDFRRKSILIDGERRFVLGPSTNVFFKSSNQVRLLSGQLWIFANRDQVLVETPMGEVATSGDVWVSGTPEAVYVLNLGGDVRVRALGVQEEIAVPGGMKNRLSGVKDGHASIGIPQMATPAEVLSSLGPLFWGTRNQFRTWIQEHSDIWDGLEDQVASLHLSLAEREIASENRRLEKERALARLRAEERQKLRRMFFQKTFGVE
ncbi:MAG: hypothetical protein K2X47_07565, partial [Bdellovibrionales bacterium]|nr:hypothetical protein [Bdellovibrionales bacterium]